MKPNKLLMAAAITLALAFSAPAVHSAPVGPVEPVMTEMSAEAQTPVRVCVSFEWLGINWEVCIEFEL